jgi:type IV pilus assembly protein PilV
MNQHKKFLAQGFTLLEVLVAVLVLSFGLLGIAGLLLASVQNNAVSTQRTAATFLAQDMADRIRSNINAIKDKNADGTPKQAYYLSTDVAANNNCFGAGSSGCTDSRTVAARDLFIWRQQIQQSLPGGTGIVCRDSTPGDGKKADVGSTDADTGCETGPSDSPFVIKIFWVVRDRADEASDNRSNFVQRYTLMLGGI